jgi:tRNA 2-selenouridine synthase
MITKLPAEEFLKKCRSERALLLDARSPSEYKQAHIPGAFNLPLLDDEQRQQVGITYKQRGKEAAVIKGFDLAGGHFGQFIKKAKELLPKETAKSQTTTPNSTLPAIYLYCWRGGLRSRIMSWVLNMGGINVILLENGYKAYRNRALEILEREKKIIILGGKTGCGKTEMLTHLRNAGEQVICLETFANHRGSAFGALGMKPQPRNEHFENLLAEEWEKLDENRPVWIENESQSIGSIVLHKTFFEKMRTAPVVEMEVDKPFRIKRIIAEYGKFPLQDLIDNTKKIEQRLGGQKTSDAIAALQSGNLEKWIDEILYYYDKAYQHGIDTRSKNTVVQIKISENDSPEVSTQKLMETGRKIMNNYAVNDLAPST